MHAVVTLAEVRTIETRRGSVRYVSTDTDGHEYTTFRGGIGERARQLSGMRVRLEYHQEQRGLYTNVYLDKIEPAGPAAGSHTDTDPQRGAWQTAVAAAPWLAGRKRLSRNAPPARTMRGTRVRHTLTAGPHGAAPGPEAVVARGPMEG